MLATPYIGKYLGFYFSIFIVFEEFPEQYNILRTCSTS